MALHCSFTWGWSTALWNLCLSMCLLLVILFNTKWIKLNCLSLCFPLTVLPERQFVLGCWQPTLCTKKNHHKSTYVILSWAITALQSIFDKCVLQKKYLSPNTHFTASSCTRKHRKESGENIRTFSGYWCWFPVLIGFPLSFSRWRKGGWQMGKLWKKGESLDNKDKIITKRQGGGLKTGPLRFSLSFLLLQCQKTSTERNCYLHQKTTSWRNIYCQSCS